MKVVRSLPQSLGFLDLCYEQAGTDTEWWHEGRKWLHCLKQWLNTWVCPLSPGARKYVHSSWMQCQTWAWGSMFSVAPFTLLCKSMTYPWQHSGRACTSHTCTSCRSPQGIWLWVQSQITLNVVFRIWIWWSCRSFPVVFFPPSSFTASDWVYWYTKCLCQVNIHLSPFLSLFFSEHSKLLKRRSLPLSSGWVFDLLWGNWKRRKHPCLHWRF